MMIKSRVSSSVMPLTRVVRPLSGTSHYSTNRTALSFPVTGLLNLRHEPATEVQLAVPKLGFSVQAVGLALPRPDQMYHLMTASDEKLRDETAVTAQPRSLGTHQTRHRLPEHVCERGLPLRRPHARHIAAEGAQARKAILAGLARSLASQLDGVTVGDALGAEGARECRLVELGISTGAREAPNVDERLDRRLAQTGDELVELPPPMADSEDA